MSSLLRGSAFNKLTMRVAPCLWLHFWQRGARYRFAVTR
jgi:hypothetical protein